MSIKEKMDLMWNEITATKNKREDMFSDFENNKEKIIELHYETEIKELQYLFLKREQLKQLKETSPDTEDVERIEAITDIAVQSLQESLIKHGFNKRLEAEKLI